MEHLIKVHGGSMYRNWTSAAMALQRLDGMEARLQSAIARSKEIFTALNKNPAITISALKDGTNIYQLTLANNIDGNKLAETLLRNMASGWAGLTRGIPSGSPLTKPCCIKMRR